MGSEPRSCSLHGWRYLNVDYRSPLRHFVQVLLSQFALRVDLQTNHASITYSFFGEIGTRLVNDGLPVIGRFGSTLDWLALEHQRHGGTTAQILPPGIAGEDNQPLWAEV